MAASNKPATTEPDFPGQVGGDEVDAMFDQGMFASLDDMLDEVVEDDSEGWVPKEKGEYIHGIVVKVSETRSDFAADGEDPMVPTVTVQTAKGDKLRAIGFSAVLKRELKDKGPMVGDGIIIKYFGERPLKTGKFAGRPVKIFAVAVKRAPQNKAAALAAGLQDK